MIGGPSGLITGCISADLGNDPTLKGNARAMSTVTGIIDGTGSVGAALVQYLVGYLKTTTVTCVDRPHAGLPAPTGHGDQSCSHWDDIFAMLLIASILAILCLTPILRKDVRLLLDQRRRKAKQRTADSDN
jgi:sugar phosphate permease